MMNSGRHIRSILCAGIAAAMMAAVSCGGNRTAKPAASAHLAFSDPPAMLAEDEKILWVADHFWDGLFKAEAKTRTTVSDTSHIAGIAKEEIEQAIANYIILVSQFQLPTSQKCIEKFTDKLLLTEHTDTASALLEQMGALVEKYFYDPNSPLRDEDLYAPFARKMSESPLIGEARRISCCETAAKASLNPRGSIAADFSFCSRQGRRYSLHAIKAEQTILFFSNPGCTACKEIIESLQSIPTLDDMIADGRLAVLNIYIDEDLAEWYKYMPVYPSNWYNCYDPDNIIRTDELYNVRAIPSLYLLDRDKRVILKDAPTDKLINNINWQK